MARSTRPVILTKNIYTLWDQKRFILQVTYFLTLEYPYAVRVRGIEIIVTMLKKQIADFKHKRRRIYMLNFSKPDKTCY